MIKINVPFLGEGIEDVTVSTWYFKEGDSVSSGQDVVEVVADKAIFNIESEKMGILKKIVVPEGKAAKIGETLAVIE
ncbi:MAG: biotin/lipoyl-containing protein [Candidatus Aceula lacicola]|nr:biotin/lipoyl-containing protein [Candidatus Aceula lacicola]